MVGGSLCVLLSESYCSFSSHGTTVKQQNYGADWGDFVSFTKYMKSVANSHGTDLLLIDTGTVDKASIICCSRPNPIAKVIFMMVLA